MSASGLASALGYSTAYALKSSSEYPLACVSANESEYALAYALAYASDSSSEYSRVCVLGCQ